MKFKGTILYADGVEDCDKESLFLNNIKALDNPYMAILNFDRNYPVGNCIIKKNYKYKKLDCELTIGNKNFKELIYHILENDPNLLDLYYPCAHLKILTKGKGKAYKVELKGINIVSLYSGNKDKRIMPLRYWKFEIEYKNKTYVCKGY